jgi:hypothetical protein
MLCKIKAGVFLTVVVALLSCALTSSLVVGQTSAADKLPRIKQPPTKRQLTKHRRHWRSIERGPRFRRAAFIGMVSPLTLIRVLLRIRPFALG